MSIIFDESNFPIITIIFPENIPEEEAVDNFFKRFLELYDTHKEFKCIFFIDKVKKIPFRYRQKVIKFSNDIKTKPNYIKECIIILNSYSIKLFIRAIFNFQKLVKQSLS